MPTNNRRSNSIDDDRIVKWNQNEWAKLLDGGPTADNHMATKSHKLCFIKFKLHLARPVDRQLCNFMHFCPVRASFGFHDWIVLKHNSNAFAKSRFLFSSNIGQWSWSIGWPRNPHLPFSSRDLLRQHWWPSVTSARSTTPIRPCQSDGAYESTMSCIISPMLWYILHFPNEPNRNGKENGMLRQRGTLTVRR